MIKFVPVTAEKLGSDFSDDLSLCGYIGFDLSAGGSECGKCVFKLNGYTMDLIYVEALNSDAETAEGLIRSALNYGANRGVYIAYYRADSFIETARLLGFENDSNSVLSGEIPELLKGSCCKGNKGD